MHEADVVALTTWTDVLAPAARLVGLYTRLWLGAEPLIDQPADAGLMLQLTPEPPGSASLKDNPLAAPAPVFAIVTVNPIESPALTLAASAVLVMTRCGS